MNRIKMVILPLTIHSISSSAPIFFLPPSCLWRLSLQRPPRRQPSSPSPSPSLWTKGLEPTYWALEPGPLAFSGTGLEPTTHNLQWPTQCPTHDPRGPSGSFGEHDPWPTSREHDRLVCPFTLSPFSTHDLRQAQTKLSGLMKTMNSKCKHYLWHFF